MNVISAGEIDRAGMESIDPLLRHGPVHVTAHDTPRYVVLTEAQYEALRRAQEEAQVARVRLAEAEIAAGNGGGSIKPPLAASLDRERVS